MIRTTDVCVTWLMDNKIKSFRIYPANGKEERGNGACFQSCSDDSFNETIEKLERWWENCGYGQYIIIQCEGNANNLKERIVIEAKGNAKEEDEPKQQKQVSFLPPEGFLPRSEMELMLENQRLKMELKMAEQELKIYKKNEEKPSATEEFCKQVTPYMGAILQGIFGKKEAAAIGTLTTQAEAQGAEFDLDISEEEFCRLSQDLIRWKSKDEDYLEIIHALSNFTDNPMYETAKSFLGIKK